MHYYLDRSNTLERPHIRGHRLLLGTVRCSQSGTTRLGFVSLVRFSTSFAPRFSIGIFLLLLVSTTNRRRDTQLLHPLSSTLASGSLQGWHRCAPGKYKGPNSTKTGGMIAVNTVAVNTVTVNTFTINTVTVTQVAIHVQRKTRLQHNIC